MKTKAREQLLCTFRWFCASFLLGAAALPPLRFFPTMRWHRFVSIENSSESPWPWNFATKRAEASGCASISIKSP